MRITITLSETEAEGARGIARQLLIMRCPGVAFDIFHKIVKALPEVPHLPRSSRRKEAPTPLPTHYD
jgi:hypothetical protein